VLATVGLADWGAATAGAEPKLSPDQLAKVHKLIKPQPG
jgi:hypothetical protein